jgi:hypothetical protein
VIDMSWTVAPAGVSRSGNCVLPAYAGAELRPTLAGIAAPVQGTGLPTVGNRQRPATQAPLAGRTRTGTPDIDVQKNDTTLGDHSSGRPLS